MGQLALNKQKATATAFLLTADTNCGLASAFLGLWEKQMGQGAKRTKGKYNCCYLQFFGLPSVFLAVWEKQMGQLAFEKEKTKGNYNCHLPILVCHLLFMVFWENRMGQRASKKGTTTAIC